MKTKYSLEIDVSGYEGPCDEGRWLGLTTLETEGNSLQECLDNAVYWLCDQDGGEAGMREADSAEFQDLIEKEFMRQYPTAHEDSDSGQALREYEKGRRI